MKAKIIMWAALFAALFALVIRTREVENLDDCLGVFNIILIIGVIIVGIGTISQILWADKFKEIVVGIVGGAILTVATYLYATAMYTLSLDVYIDNDLLLLVFYFTGIIWVLIVGAMCTFFYLRYFCRWDRKINFKN